MLYLNTVSRNKSLCSNNKKNPFNTFLEYQPQNVENNIGGSQKQSLDEAKTSAIPHQISLLATLSHKSSYKSAQETIHRSQDHNTSVNTKQYIMYHNTMVLY